MACKINDMLNFIQFVLGSCKKGYKVGRVSGEGYSCVRVAQQIQGNLNSHPLKKTVNRGLKITTALTFLFFFF